MKRAFFGSEIREAEARVGLNNSDGRQEGKVEAFGDGLSTNYNIKVTGFDLVVECVE